MVPTPPTISVEGKVRKGRGGEGQREGRGEKIREGKGVEEKGGKGSGNEGERRQRGGEGRGKGVPFIALCDKYHRCKKRSRKINNV